jgi:OOP family OmpA-OmpF porin
MKIVLCAAAALMLACGLAGPARADDQAPEVYVVFFAFNDAAVSPVAGRVLDHVIADFRRTRATEISVRGYTDLAGPIPYNMKLSARRSDAVARYLVAHGIKPKALRTEWYGKTHPRVATADGVRNDENRRSEIVLRK